jgi:hypothetical protein
MYVESVGLGNGNVELVPQLFFRLRETLRLSLRERLPCSLNSRERTPIIMPVPVEKKNAGGPFANEPPASLGSLC